VLLFGQDIEAIDPVANPHRSNETTVDGMIGVSPSNLVRVSELP